MAFGIDPGTLSVGDWVEDTDPADPADPEMVKITRKISSHRYEATGADGRVTHVVYSPGELVGHVLKG